MSVEVYNAPGWILPAFILAVAALGLLFLRTIFRKPRKKPEADQTASLNANTQAPEQTNVLRLLSSITSNFDREMYIDDMSPAQLEDEHVWRTAFITSYNVSWTTGSLREDHPCSKICQQITGKPFDRQLAGLTEYYIDTAYDQMMVAGEDRYWNDELIAQKDLWDPRKREQIILAALVTLAKGAEIQKVLGCMSHAPEDYGASLNSEIDRVGEAFFGEEAENRMAALRTQAARMAEGLEF